PNRPRLLSMVALGDLLGATDLETDEPAALARGLRRAFRTVRRPTVLLVQGIEELPLEDSAILEDLLSSPPEGRVLLVATAATRRAAGTPTPGLPGLAQRAGEGGRCHVAELAPPSVDEVSALMEDEVGTGA